MLIEPDDLTYNKAAIIERCIKRIKEEYANDPEFRNNTHLDAMTLNIERACQSSIDLAMHWVSKNKLGIPQTSTEAFYFLHQADIIDSNLLHSLRAMCGFRNVAVHEYSELDLSVLAYIATKGINDFVKFCDFLGITIKK